MRNNAKGFSLVELMCTVAIVAILASVSSAKVKSLVIQARQAEAKIFLHQISVLQHSYQADTGFFLGNPSFNTNLSFQSISSSTACQIGNPIGFTIKDCQNARYYYVLMPSPSTGFIATAEEMVISNKGRVMNCLVSFGGLRGRGIDSWTYTSEDVMTQGPAGIQCRLNGYPDYTYDPIVIN